MRTRATLSSSPPPRSRVARLARAAVLAAALPAALGCTVDVPGAGGERAASAASPLEARRVNVVAMAPLVVGRLDAPHDPAHEAAWRAFDADLAEAKALGVRAVSFDVWWGAVEREGDQRFDFRWVDRVVEAILRAGLDLRPVLAFHACGTNVGDTCDVPLPAWVFDRYVGQDVPVGGGGAEGPRVLGGARVTRPDDLLYRSAQGRTSREVLSAWATPLVVAQYREFVEAFVARYARHASRVHGIAVGLGAASELRYPSYNAHDDGAGYPGEGVLQAYGPLAAASFRRWALERHGGLEGVSRAWGRPHASEDEIRVPDPAGLGWFFAQNEHHATAYGRDVFAWYRASLLAHGHLVLAAAADAVQASPLRGARLVARVPGVHWRAGDTRRAELSAGLLSTSDADGWDDDAAGHGYGALVDVVADLRARADRPNVTLDFTCLEMGNGEGGPAVASRAEDLVFWFADAAHRRGVPVGGENALADGVRSERGWSRMKNAVAWSHYDELTLLRLHDVVTSPVARREVPGIARGR